MVDLQHQIKVNLFKEVKHLLVLEITIMQKLMLLEVHVLFKSIHLDLQMILKEERRVNHLEHHFKILHLDQELKAKTNMWCQLEDNFQIINYMNE